MTTETWVNKLISIMVDYDIYVKTLFLENDTLSLL